jgi:glyoxylase-like metal-dependent hydrolase (beta-lactamase superfamily II)
MTTSANSISKLPNPTVTKINDHVYALVGPLELPNRKNRGYMVNSTVIIGDKGVILIDTGFSHEIGLHIKNTISTITDKPVTHIINTHDHGDHTLGNSAFRNTTIISSEKCKAVMEKTGYEWIGLLENMTGLKFPDSKPVVATKAYPENTHTKITLQGIKMEIWVPQGSHTSNDLMIYLPEDGILIAGDILVKGIVPSFRDAYVSNWIHTLQQISKMKLSTIVPGHGDLMTTGDVKAMHAYMKKLYTGIEAGYKKGLMDSEVRKELDLSKWKKLKHFDDLMGMNINRTYLEVEAANF